MPSLSETVKNSGVGLRAVNGSSPLNTDIVSEDPIHINCSGYNYFDPNVNRIRIERTKGRQDYQLLYIQEGSGEFWFNNRKQILKKGTLCLFRPHVPQVYSYLNDETTISYFVHFSGSWIPKLLAPFGPQDQICFYIENALFFGETILKISRALQLHEYNYDLECAALLLDLITKLSRSVSLAPASGPQTTNAFAPALNVMNNQYRKTLSIEEYAELCGMSTYYFVRKFKEHTGFSPHFYLIKVRMERAKEFLLTTNMNVSEISYSVGYDNPLYFSRMFKKYTGVSPVNFRKQVTTPQLFMEDTDAE
ncbi:MAG: helix-turn-helix transcriptional regulator [Lachnospiraceae bacterium]|nr:helix-turn-helix transcriptional regulator [Lachnospiraceae bacterium]